MSDITTLAPAVDAASDPTERRKGIGGSDVAVILGLSPYKTPLDLWAEKRGLWVDESASEAAHWGTVMEPVLASEYVRRYAAPLVRRDGYGEAQVLGMKHMTIPFELAPELDRLTGTLTHPEYPWARGHVDGIGLTEGARPSHLCEFKTADSRLSHLWGEEDTDQVPEPYLVQVQWYLWLTGLEVAHVAALIGGNRFRRYIVERDDQLIPLLIERAAEFWAKVESGEPPAVTERDNLARIFPSGTEGKEIAVLPGAPLSQLAEALHYAREASARLDDRKKLLENEVKLLMADATRITLGPKSYLSWTNNKDSQTTDWQAAARFLAAEFALTKSELDETLARFTTTKPGARVFRVQNLGAVFGEEG